MSRLYLEGTTDAIKGRRTARGNTFASAHIFYGSKDDSKLAAMVSVTWDKDQDRPQVRLLLGKDVERI